ncbi:MAG: gliding motility-associated C-terminal domain-containing protein [Prevotellaceae bacterium]|jgi:gliding motility-associated-like protein|nr:gliding motility-associated C-terminal domain-containing protein [Prevotellaceae bacterium]
MKFRLFLFHILCFCTYAFSANAEGIKVEIESTPNAFCNPKCDYNGPTIMINEVMTTPKEYNNSIYGQQCPSAQRGGGEWVELYNPDPCNPVDISGYFFGNAIIDFPACNSVKVRGIGGAFIFPEGTIVPPNGFCILLGEFGKEIEPGLLVENGGNTVQIKLMDYFDRFCIDAPGNRFWLPDQGGWFALYDKNGVPQDAIYWGETGADICADCTPCNPQKEGFFMGELPALDAFPADRRHRIRYKMDYLLHEELTPKRIPDGGEWSYATYTTHNNGYCNANCTQRISTDCNGTATITTLTTGNYSYLWNDAKAQTTPTATGLCEGTYCCTIIDNDTQITKQVCVTVEKKLVTEEIIAYLIPGGSYQFGDRTLNSPGIYERTEKGENSCDKLIILDLRMDLPGCIADGRLLFKEDFGGNEVSDLAIMTDADMVKKYSDPTNQEANIIIGHMPRQNPAAPGSYSVRKEGQHHNSWWVWMDDHTFPYDYTRGYLMQIDGSTNPSANQFYKKQIDGLCAGSQLYFSMWAASVATPERHGQASLALVIEDINGNELKRINTGAIPYAGDDPKSDYTEPLAANDWAQYGTTFTIEGDTPSVVFKIINGSTAYIGNDFVLDDIEIYLCVPPVTIENVTACEGEKATLKGEFQNAGSFVEPLVYRWQKSQTGDMENPGWTNVGTNSDELNFAAVKTADAGYYRLLVGNAGTIDSENCRSVSEPVYLKVNTPKQTNLQETICEGTSYSFDNQNLTATGMYTQNLKTKEGCDSIVTLNLTVIPKKQTAISEKICDGESYSFGGVQRTQSGKYQHTFISKAGCDSIVTLTLTVYKKIEKQIAETICEGERYSFDGKELATDGVYTGNFKTIHGCDSIVTLTLTVKPAKRTAISGKICEGEKYDFNGQMLSTAGIYHQTLQAANSCDSLVTLTLSVNKKDYSDLGEVVIKDSETYFFAGKELSQPGTYSDIQKNIHGCDSIITLTLRMLPDNIAPPEVFTPNGDGKNDRFEIKNLELYPKNSILIFNRWGNKVFEASPYHNDWDGRNHFGIRVGGDQLPAGTYFYILNLGDGTEPRKGYVYISRE